MAEDLINQIKELRAELLLKDSEIMRYRSELAKINGQLEKMIAGMSQELKLAGLIQKILSPTEIPNIPGIEFSTKFLPGMNQGGDYFDIFEHEDKLKFGIVLSCCSGYAMSALLLSVLIKLSAQIEARRGLDPEKVLLSVVKELGPEVGPKDSASLFYGVVDRRTFELKYSSIGKISGFLQVQGEDQISFLEPCAGPLVKNFGTTPLAHSLQLGARDRLILCTEGVVEAKSRSGETFGRDRLGKAIHRAPRSGVHELRNEILYQMEKFTETTEVERDVTVLVTEVKDRVIKLAKK